MYISSTCDTSINQYLKRDHEKNIHACRSTQCWLLYPLHNYFPLKTKIQIEKIVPNCGQNVQHRYKYFVLGRYKSYFVKKKTLILPKKFSEMISSKYLSFWLTTYLLCLMDMFFKSVGIPMGTNCPSFR
jgi:hypothetical protein